MNIKLNPTIVIPGVDKITILAADKILPIETGLIITTFVLSWRAQFAATVKSALPTAEAIQATDTGKYLAKQIARFPEIRRVLASLIVAKTAALQVKVDTSLKDKTAEEITVAMRLSAIQLADDPPPPGSRVLPAGAINDPHALRVHRSGSMAQLIGTLQSRPVYSPGDIVKNVSLPNFDLASLYTSMIALFQVLEIPVSPEIQAIFQSANFEHELNEFIVLNFFSKLPAHSQPVFHDEVRIGTKDNKLPLEQFDIIQRSQYTGETTAVAIPQSLIDADSPLAKVIESAIKSTQKSTVPSKKTTPQSTPKSSDDKGSTKASSRRSPSRR